jgi:hypothetical protein
MPGFNNVIILRYEDILLMRAEALNELNGPTQASIDLSTRFANAATCRDLRYPALRTPIFK